MNKMNIQYEILKMSWFEHSKKLDELHKLYSPDHPQISIVKNALEEIKFKIDQQK
jgi:hypothetical protein